LGGINESIRLATLAGSWTGKIRLMLKHLGLARNPSGKRE
jgi:hypothetical protein